MNGELVSAERYNTLNLKSQVNHLMDKQKHYNALWPILKYPTLIRLVQLIL